MDQTSALNPIGFVKQRWSSYRKWKGSPFLSFVLLNIALSWPAFNEPVYPSFAGISLIVGLSAFWPVVLYLMRFRLMSAGSTGAAPEVVPIKNLAKVFLVMLMILPSGYLFWTAARWLAGR